MNTRSEIDSIIKGKNRLDKCPYCDFKPRFQHSAKQSVSTHLWQMHKDIYKSKTDQILEVFSRKLLVKCGDANPNGNVYMFYKGGCQKVLDKRKAFRCTGCGGWFHKECILKHFKLEKDHDWGRLEEKKAIVRKLREYQKTYPTMPLSVDGVISLLEGKV